MELKQLVYFITLADTLNFSRASELLYVSQSTLSKQISALESELNVRLVLRDTHSVLLTPIGMEFLREAREVIAAAERAVETVQNSTSTDPEKTICLGIDSRIDLTTMLTTEIVQMVKRFGKEHPDVNVSYKNYEFKELWGALQDDQIDAALMLHETDDIAHFLIPQLNSVVIYSDPMVLLLPRASVPDSSAPLTQILSKFEVIVVPEHHSQFSTTGSLLNALGVQPMVRFCNSWTQILSMVASGKGYTYAPLKNYSQLDLQEIIPIRIPKDPICAEMVIRWKKTTKNSNIQDLIRAANNRDEK